MLLKFWKTFEIKFLHVQTFSQLLKIGIATQWMPPVKNKSIA